MSKVEYTLEELLEHYQGKGDRGPDGDVAFRNELKHGRPTADRREPAQRDPVSRRGRRSARVLRLEPVGCTGHTRHRGRVGTDPPPGVRDARRGRVCPELSRDRRADHRRGRRGRRRRNRWDRPPGDRHQGECTPRVVRRRVVRDRARHPAGLGPVRHDLPSGGDPARAPVLAPPLSRAVGRRGTDVRVQSRLPRARARGVAVARALPRRGRPVRRPRAAGDVHQIQRHDAAARRSYCTSTIV